MIDLNKLEKQVRLAQSFIHWTKEGSGDPELMAKLAELHVEDINKTVLRLLNVSKEELTDKRNKANEWIDFLDFLLSKR